MKITFMQGKQIRVLQGALKMNDYAFYNALMMSFGCNQISKLTYEQAEQLIEHLSRELQNRLSTKIAKFFKWALKAV